MLTAFKHDGAKVTVTFPNSSAVNPNDAEAEDAFKLMKVWTAGSTFGAACT